MVTLRALHEMKREGRKIVAVVAWDCHIATIADRAGVELVSVGDSVGVNLWGRADADDVSIDEMALVCRAVRHGVKRALVSCDFPHHALRQGVAASLAAAQRLREAGADLVKLDQAAEHLDAVEAVARAGIPVFAQFDGQRGGADFVAQARRLEAAGAALLDFKHSGPRAGAAVTQAVSIPVLGGQGGGPWLDGRIRLAHAAIGYGAGNIDAPADTYANVARIALAALGEYAADVRAGRLLKGQRPG